MVQRHRSSVAGLCLWVAFLGCLQSLEFIHISPGSFLLGVPFLSPLPPDCQRFEAARSGGGGWRREFNRLRLSSMAEVGFGFLVSTLGPDKPGPKAVTRPLASGNTSVIRRTSILTLFVPITYPLTLGFPRLTRFAIDHRDRLGKWIRFLSLLRGPPCSHR